MSTKECNDIIRIIITIIVPKTSCIIIYTSELFQGVFGEHDVFVSFV